MKIYISPLQGDYSGAPQHTWKWKILLEHKKKSQSGLWRMDPTARKESNSRASGQPQRRWDSAQLLFSKKNDEHVLFSRVEKVTIRCTRGSAPKVTKIAGARPSKDNQAKTMIRYKILCWTGSTSSIFISFIHCRHLYSASSSGATQKRSQPQRGRIMLF